MYNKKIIANKNEIFSKDLRQLYLTQHSMEIKVSVYNVIILFHFASLFIISLFHPSSWAIDQ